MSVNASLPRVFRMAGWFKIVSAAATLLLCAAGTYYMVWGANPLHRGGGVALFVFGLAGLADTLVSRIVLDEDAIRVVSLVRTRTYPRADLESAKVDGGAVFLQKRGGGWLKLPDTGANSLSMRNTIHAWIKAKEKGAPQGAPDS
jgi:hypothetical protein